MMPRYVRRILRVISAVVVMAMVLPSGADISIAEDAGATGLADITPLAEGMSGRISLDLRNIDIVEALKFLAIKTGINIIATKNVAGRVTLMVDNVAVKDIFDIMLRSNGLAYTKQGDVYNVMTEEEYKAIFGKRFADLRQVKVFRLKYAIPDQAFSMLDTLKSDIGRVLVEPDSGTALIMDTPEKIDVIEKAMASLEEKNIVKVFTLKYAKAKEVEEQLKTQLDAKKVGSVKADERLNQVIVQTLPNRMTGIEKLVNLLDGKTKEVLIDTKIIKVKLTDQLDQGIQWEGLASLGKELGFTYLGTTPFSVLQPATNAWVSRQVFRNNNTPTGVGAYPFSGNTSSVNSGTAVSPGESLHFGIISQKRDIDLFIKYMQTLGNTQILAAPTLAVINNHEARIHVGERQAYVTTTTTTGQTTTTVSEQVTFVDVGIQLAVTPTINDEGYITMKVKPEVSSVVSTLITPSNNKIPIIDTSMAETTVMVNDGATIIIGGLRREDKTSTSEQIPYLANIPIIGFMFKSKTGKKERTELLVMITPHIVTGKVLTTGDERHFNAEAPGKEYGGYKKLEDNVNFEPARKRDKDEKKPDALIMRSGEQDTEQESGQGVGESIEDLDAANQMLSARLKPYKDYSSVKSDMEEPEPGIKGERDD